jgi:predicted CoA-binding protein
MNSIAIVGASADRRKFGNKAVRAFLKAGWQVYPVNPGGGEIEGLPVSPTLDDVPAPVTAVSMYLAPATGITLLPKIQRLGAEILFLNPGAESPELIKFAEGLGLHPRAACSIVFLGYVPAMFPDE